MNIVIAGATGFVGKELCQTLAKQHRVIAMTRRARLEPDANDLTGAANGIFWRSANLFSLLEVERAMAGADVAVYLVHSMLPSSRLTQGNFADLDVILADNFARAAKLKGVKRLVYLGGIIPRGILSPHLHSRREVEQVLAAQGVPLVTLRAGLVIGANSSSFRIMEHLVGRLPLMICPKWTTTRCQPIALGDVTEVLEKVILDDGLAPGHYDIGGPDILSYVDMMGQVAKELRVKRYFLRVPFITRWLSRLWVSTVTGTTKALVYPLIESLEHDMVAEGVHLQDRYALTPKSFSHALQIALQPSFRVMPKPTAEVAGSPPQSPNNMPPTVISVQRLPLASCQLVSGIASEYAAWLPKFLSPILKIETTPGGQLQFFLQPALSFGPKWLLLELTYSESRSSRTRQLYYITGGLLVRRPQPNAVAARGRLEFRAIPGAQQCLAAVLDFRPSLPWWLYRISQAQVHVLVMRFFKRHLQRGKLLRMAGEPDPGFNLGLKRE